MKGCTKCGRVIYEAEGSWDVGNEVLCQECWEAYCLDVVAWGEETCPHDIFGEGTQCSEHAHDMCWHELKEGSNES